MSYYSLCLVLKSTALGAWWVELKGNNFLEPLKLDCDGYKILTLDLLLIGTRDVVRGEDDKKEVKWHGAAISNIKFDRTECTVQLVTKEARLNDIEAAVKQLCQDFTLKKQFHIEVEDYGEWKGWPDGVKSLKDE